MSEKSCVSVIIPCYRCSDTIERAVASVAAQTLQPAEVILIDDCSGDSTLATLNEIRACYPQGWIKVIASTENGGAGAARNIGWAAATQAYIAFLDSDDSWHPQKIEIQYGWMIKHPEATLTGHTCRQVYDEDVNNGQIEFSAADAEFYAVSKNQLLLSNRFSTPSVMLRSVIEQRFSEGKRYSEDFQLWLEVCCGGLACYRTELPLANLHKAPYGVSGLSAMLWKMEKGELDSYRSVHRIRGIGLYQLFALCTWSFLKYLNRVLKIFMRKVVEKFR